MTANADPFDSLAAGLEDVDAADLLVVETDGFEGPLHLLLALARRQKVDLLRVSILDLADQYLAFIETLRTRRIDLAADYLLMAAWLAWLKSRLLLPGKERPAEAADDSDLARQLSFRLARLDAMKRASAALWDGHLDGRDVFRRGAPERSVVTRETDWQASLYDLLTAFGDIQIRQLKVRAHVVKRQPVLSLDVARRRLKAILAELEEWRPVQGLPAPPEDSADAPRRSVVASFFSAALELAKENAVELRQDQPGADLMIRRARAAVAPSRPVARAASARRRP